MRVQFSCRCLQFFSVSEPPIHSCFLQLPVYVFDQAYILSTLKTAARTNSLFTCVLTSFVGKTNENKTVVVFVGTQFSSSSRVVLNATSSSSSFVCKNSQCIILLYFPLYHHHHHLHVHNRARMLNKIGRLIMNQAGRKRIFHI